MDIQNKDNIILQYLQADLDTAIRLLPSTSSKITSQELSIQYETDKLGFEWRKQNMPVDDYLFSNKEFLAREYSKHVTNEENPSTSSIPNKENLLDAKG